MQGSENNNIIDEQISSITSLIKNGDIQSVVNNGVISFLKLIFFKDASAPLELMGDTRKLCMYFPTIMFWNKEITYLNQTFHSKEEQVIFAKKFNDDNEKMEEFVRNQLYFIDKMESEKKIKFVADLTRCFFLYNMDYSLYNRLLKFIDICTADELMYMKEKDYSCKMENNALVSILISVC